MMPFLTSATSLPDGLSAAGFPELVADKAELHSLLVGWHDNIGHALLTALGSPESVCTAVLEHENERQIAEIKTLSDVLYVANKIANRTASWRDPEFGGSAVDTSVLDSLFDAAALKEIVDESEEEVASLKAALGA